MRVPITVPDSAMPKKDPVNPCPCQFRPFRLKDKTGEVFWLVSQGERVCRGQVVCEGEVEKKTVELPAPADGVLAEICVPEEGQFAAGTVLGYIETEGKP